jgi:hypothetical protein
MSSKEDEGQKVLDIGSNNSAKVTFFYSFMFNERVLLQVLEYGNKFSE